MRSLIIFLVTVLSGLCVSAQATTLTFDELPPGSVVGNHYLFSGFGLHSTPSPWSSNNFRVSANESALWTGSQGLIVGGVSAPIELKSNDRTPFNVISIDISRGDSNGNIIPVTFTGIKEEGGKVYATYWFSDSIFGKSETFLFGESFNNINSLQWFQGASWHQFDNIVLSSAVAEPGSLMLILPAMFLLAAGRRRNRKG